MYGYSKARTFQLMQAVLSFGLLVLLSLLAGSICAADVNTESQIQQSGTPASDSSDVGVQLNGLNNRLNKLEALTHEYSNQVKKLNASYLELKVELDFRIANGREALLTASKYSESFPYCSAESVSSIDFYSQSARLLKKRVQEMKAVYGQYVKASGKAGPVADKICAYNLNSVTSPLSDTKIVLPLVRESEKLLKELEDTNTSFLEGSRALGELSGLLAHHLEKVRSMKLHLQACTAVAGKLEDCKKDQARVEEIRAQIGESLKWTNFSRSGLYGMVSALRTQAGALSTVAGGKDPVLENEILQIQNRITAAGKLLDQSNLSFVMPAIPKVACDRYAGYDLGPSASRLSKANAFLVLGEPVLAEAQGAALIISESSDHQEFTRNINRARECYARLKKRIEHVPTIRDLEGAADEAAALHRDLLNDRAKISESADLCSDAQFLWGTIENHLARIIKMEKLVDGTLRAAQELAAKCPDIQNPENIRTLYDKAEQFTVEIAKNVALLIRDRNTIDEKLTLAEAKRSDADADAAATMEKVERLHEISRYIANRISPVGAGYWKTVVGLVRESRALSDEIQASEKCVVPALDKPLAQAENAYTAAATNLGSHESLVERATQCATLVNEQEKNYTAATAAVDACDFDKAKSLIDAMPDNPKKTGIQTDYKEAVALEKRLRKMVNVDAKGKYKNCEFDAAIKVLMQALPLAKCTIHKDKIKHSITLAESGQRLKTELEKLVNTDARAKYDSCDFEGALKILDSARAKAKCKSHLMKINNSARIVRAKQKYEETSEMLYEQAMIASEAGRYDDALAKLQEALEHTKCESMRERIGVAVAMVKRKNTPSSEEQVAGLDCSMYGESEPYWDGTAGGARCRCLPGTILRKNRCEPDKTDIQNNVRDDKQTDSTKFSCVIQEYRDPLNPAKAGIVISEEQGKKLVLHVTNMKSKCNALVTKIDGPVRSTWGQQVSGSSHLKCEFVAGGRYADAVAAAKKDCAKWREQQCVQYTATLQSLAADSTYLMGIYHNYAKEKKRGDNVRAQQKIACNISDNSVTIQKTTQAAQSAGCNVDIEDPVGIRAVYGLDCYAARQKRN